MSDPYWLTEKQMKCLRPSFPKSHGRPRLDDRRVLSGIVFMNRNGLCWQDAPWEDRPHRILRTCWKRWSVAGIFIRLIDGLAAGTADHQTIMNDATSLKAHRTASSLRAEKGMRVALIGWTGGGMNTKLHAVTEWSGRPLGFSMTAGPISDYIGAAALLDSLSATKWLLADRDYDADCFRNGLEEKGIRPCIPGRRSRTTPVRYDKRKYRRRNRIEIMFGRLKDWRRIATRYDRCPTVFFSAI